MCNWNRAAFVCCVLGHTYLISVCTRLLPSVTMRTTIREQMRACTCAIHMMAIATLFVGCMGSGCLPDVFPLDELGELVDGRTMMVAESLSADSCAEYCARGNCTGFTCGNETDACVCIIYCTYGVVYSPCSETYTQCKSFGLAVNTSVPAVTPNSERREVGHATEYTYITTISFFVFGLCMFGFFVYSGWASPKYNDVSLTDVLVVESDDEDPDDSANNDELIPPPVSPISMNSLFSANVADTEDLKMELGLDTVEDPV